MSLVVRGGWHGGVGGGYWVWRGEVDVFQGFDGVAGSYVVLVVQDIAAIAGCPYTLVR